MATLSMPRPTHPLTPVPLASRPLSTHSLASSTHRAYAPRKSSPLAEGVSTSRPSSLLLSSPPASPPDSPRSLSFSFTESSTNSSAPAMLCPKPIHSKPLPMRVHTVRRSATASFTPKPAPPPSSPHNHRRTQSTQPTSSAPIGENPPQVSAPETPGSFRPVKPSTSRVPEENWMTSESAPRFTRESLALGAVVLPVRKDDAQRLIRRSTGAHIKYATTPNTAIGTSLSVSNVNQFGSSRKTVVQKTSQKVPSVRIVDVDGTIQTVDEVGVDLSKRDGTWKKETAPFRHVRKFSKDLAAKMKIRGGQVKPTMTVTEGKRFDPVLTEKLAVEKDESGRHPRPPGISSKRTKSIWGYIIGSSR